ncbi:MAG: hypothetical protein AAFR67_06280, partial [Chloroflexota bacterium]
KGISYKWDKPQSKLWCQHCVTVGVMPSPDTNKTGCCLLGGCRIVINDTQQNAVACRESCLDGRSPDVNFLTHLSFV